MALRYLIEQLVETGQRFRDKNQVNPDLNYLNWAEIKRDLSAIEAKLNSFAPVNSDSLINLHNAIFDGLDRSALAYWVVRQNPLGLDFDEQIMESWKSKISKYNDFVLDNPELFQDRLDASHEILNNCVEDLDETHYELWETLIKFRAIEEFFEERDSTSALPFSEAEKAEIIELAKKMANRSS